MSTFQYPRMTPELQAYLNHIETDVVSEEWRTERKRLVDLVPPEVFQDYHQAKVTWFCRDETQAGDPKVVVSPGGQYRLVLTEHETRRGCWAYTKGKVFKGDQLLFEVCRNYSHFPYLFVEGHPNGHDYLVCGEDYQGQTVLELDTGKRVDYLPPNALKGHGFCWAQIHISPSKNTLAVEGCIWAGPEEVMIMDFSDPMSLPYPLLERGDHPNFYEWTGPDACRIGYEIEIYKPLEKRTDFLTTEEFAEYCAREEAGEDVVRTERIQSEWTRPSNEESARRFCQLIKNVWVARSIPVNPDYLQILDKMLPWISDQKEREDLNREIRGSSGGESGGT